MFSERPKIHCESRQKIMTFMVTTPKLLQFLPFFANLQKFNAVISFQNSEK